MIKNTASNRRIWTSPTDSEDGLVPILCIPNTSARVERGRRHNHYDCFLFFCLHHTTAQTRQRLACLHHFARTRHDILHERPPRRHFFTMFDDTISRSQFCTSCLTTARDTITCIRLCLLRKACYSPSYSWQYYSSSQHGQGFQENGSDLHLDMGLRAWMDRTSLHKRGGFCWCYWRWLICVFMLIRFAFFVYFTLSLRLDRFVAVRWDWHEMRRGERDLRCIIVAWINDQKPKSRSIP